MATNVQVLRDIPFHLVGRPDLTAEQRHGTLIASFETASPLEFLFTFLIGDDVPAEWVVSREAVTAAIETGIPLAEGDFQLYWDELSTTDVLIRLIGDGSKCTIRLRRYDLMQFLCEVAENSNPEADAAALDSQLDDLLAELFDVPLADDDESC